MANYVSWIEQKGHRILYCNFSGIKDEAELVRGFDEMEKEVLSQSKGVKYTSLIDVTGTVLTQVVTDRARRMLGAVKAAGYPDLPTAIVGAMGFQKAVISALSLFRQDIQVCDTVEEAKDWLVIEGEKLAR